MNRHTRLRSLFAFSNQQTTHPQQQERGGFGDFVALDGHDKISLLGLPVTPTGAVLAGVSGVQGSIRRSNGGAGDCN